MEIRDTTLYLQGPLQRELLPELYRRVSRLSQNWEILDLSDVSDVDSDGVTFVRYLMQLGPGERTLQHVPEQVQQLLDIFSDTGATPDTDSQRPSLFERLGARFMHHLQLFRSALLFTADVTIWSVIGLFDRSGQRKGATRLQTLLIGVDALGIILLLSLILGLILALQSAAQLRQFGANIYVADLLAISMVREMGPMMTAIIVAGRSGSAIAAEVATMKVTEELDALQMMALDPVRYLMVPKFHAMTVSLPLLVMLSIITGILGGLLVGITYLDLSTTSYILETFSAVGLNDLAIGLGKSLFFGWVIVIIGGYSGMQVRGGAEGVGRATTQAVVVSIFSVIVLDALFSLAFLV